jgi:hypothetical protein
MKNYSEFVLSPGGTYKLDSYQHYVFDNIGKLSKTSSVGIVTLDGFSDYRELLKP